LDVAYRRHKQLSMEKIIELTECMAAGEPERYDELLDWNKTEWTNINHEKKLTSWQKSTPGLLDLLGYGIHHI
jgi:hypothetical protein